MEVWAGGRHQELVLQKWKGWWGGPVCGEEELGEEGPGTRGGDMGCQRGEGRFPGPALFLRGVQEVPQLRGRELPPELPPPGSWPTLAPRRVLGPAAARLASLCPPSIPPRHPDCLDRVPHLA